MKPEHIHDLQWSQALAVARQACAKVFRDGGLPEDALMAFGLERSLCNAADWSRTVDAIAETLCHGPDRIAA